MLAKTKRVRLKGKALKALNAAIHERDGHCCVVCGHYVDPGEKFHHEPPGAGKSDVIEQGVTLCMSCHTARHFGADCTAVKIKILEYLYMLYGGENPEQWQ